MNFNFSQLLDLKGDSAPFSEIRQRIASDASVKGANLVILITAILIASVGLNMNSTAVIIGAMLISPLMGGLVATGYGMATYDMQFIKDSMVKLGFQVSFALITSAIYFSLSPISDASSELLARTSPTIWDVIIALAGGIAGAIGNTRKEKTNVIPGVAIATALMPPLCTAGYGIATHSSTFGLGALYLFFINAFFITLSAFLVFKVLRVPASTTVNESHMQYQRTILLIAGIVITIPSIYMAYLTVNDNIRDTQIKTFIAKEVASEKVSAVSYAFKDGLLTVDLIGTPLTEDQVAELQASMQSYSKLTDAKLHIVQGNVNTIGQKKIQQIITNRIEGLVANDKGKSYKELASLYYPAYQTQQSDEQITVAMNAQLPALFPQIVAAQGSTMPAHSTDASTSGSQSQQFLAKLTVSAPLSPTDAAKIQQWLKTQTDSPVSLIVQMQGQDSSFYGNGIAWE